MNKLNKLIGSLLLSAFMLIGVGVNGNTKDVVRGNAETQSCTIKGTSAKIVINGVTKTGAKAGTGKAAGTITVTIPANATKLSFYAGLWNKGTGSISMTLSSGSATTTSFAATMDAGIASNSPFTLKETDESKFLCSTELSDITSEVTATFTKVSKDYRFIMWDASCEVGSSVATKIASAALVDSSKIFYCGEEIKASDFIAKDDTGATITDFTIDKTTVPNEAGDFTLTFSKEGLTSFNLSLTAVAKVLDFELSTTSISGMIGKKVNVKATANKFIENPNYTWEVSEGSDIVTLSATSGDNVDVTLILVGTAKIKVTETTSNISKEISVTSEERVSTIKEPVEKTTTNESTTVYEMVGKVTGVYGNSYFIQDGKYAMYVFNKPDVETGISPKIGDIASVKATTILYYKWIETKTISEQKIDNTLKILDFSTNEFENLASLTDEKQNTLFNINNLTYKSGTYGEKDLNIIFSLGSDEISYRTDVNMDSTIQAAIKEKIDEIISKKDTCTVNLKNVHLTKYNSTWQFKIPTADSIEIVENKLTSLKVELADSTKEYVVGSKLATSDLKVTKVFEDGSELTASTSDYTVSPDLSTYELVAGENVFTITSTKDETIKTTITINAIEDILTELKVSGTARNQYVGEKLNTTDLVFTATYSKSGDKVISHSEITFSPDTMPTATINNYTIKATYKDKEVSFNVNVIEREKGFYLSTNANELEAGDLLLIVNRSTSNVMSELADLSGKASYFTVANLNSLNKDTTFISWEDIYLTNTVYTVLSLGGSKDAWTFKDTITDEEIATSTDGAFTYNTATTWKITSNSDNTTSIKSNVSGLTKPYIRYNVGSPRFTTYGNQIDASLPYPELFVMKANVLDDTIVKTKLAALKWALSFNTNIIKNCDPTGATIKIDDKLWKTTKDAYNALSSDIKAYLKDETANENGNLIEKSLYYYDYIMSKYSGSTEYIEYIEGRTISKSSTPLLTNSDNTETIGLIAIISVVSLSAIGGYMFIRKRKEQ